MKEVDAMLVPQPVALDNAKQAGLYEAGFGVTTGPTTQSRLSEVRVLMYSHDTFGLGHLRRCRTIAHALVEHFKGVHVIIISGSQIAGAFDFKARVDFVKIPSVIKLYNGEYTSIGQHIDIRETLEWRQQIIDSTAKAYQPDLMIVDKEPLGLRGEMLSTLQNLKDRGVRLVLGLRDVMDDDIALAAEWKSRDVLRHIDALYDDIWIYGPKGFWNPLNGLPVPESVERRFTYTGFLERPRLQATPSAIEELPPKFVLATAGGGGDGAPLMHAIVSAYEGANAPEIPVLMVLGPFMGNDDKLALKRRAASLGKIIIIDFHNRPELLLMRASGVIGMAGYNTFCEVLSFDKPALLVPRMQPRLEQFIRAREAARLGLVDMLTPEEATDPLVLGHRIGMLGERSPPSHHGAADMLSGIGRICEEVKGYFASPLRQHIFLPPAAE